MCSRLWFTCCVCFFSSLVSYWVFFSVPVCFRCSFFPAVPLCFLSFNSVFLYCQFSLPSSSSHLFFRVPLFLAASRFARSPCLAASFHFNFSSTSSSLPVASFWLHRSTSTPRKLREQRLHLNLFLCASSKNSAVWSYCEGIRRLLYPPSRRK